MRASEAEASQDNETLIETRSNIDNVSSVRYKEAVLIDPTQNENEVQAWTQTVTCDTNGEMAEVRT